MKHFAFAFSLGALSLGALVPAPALAEHPPIRDYDDPGYQALSAEEYIAACDQYAAHPLDPMKPDDVEGVLEDSDLDALSAYLYCFRAFQADQENPRIMFQWGRANQAFNTRSTAQPRHMYKLAYREGSEIAGIYLAKTPPDRQMSLDEMVALMDSMRGPQAQSRPMTSQERDELLINSIIVIGSVAMLRILNGEAEWGSGECSGGYAINPSTHEVVCNGLVVGTY